MLTNVNECFFSKLNNLKFRKFKTDFIIFSLIFFFIFKRKRGFNGLNTPIQIMWCEFYVLNISWLRHFEESDTLFKSNNDVVWVCETYAIISISVILVAAAITNTHSDEIHFFFLVFRKLFKYQNDCVPRSHKKSFLQWQNVDWQWIQEEKNNTQRYPQHISITNLCL